MNETHDTEESTAEGDSEACRECLPPSLPPPTNVPSPCVLLSVACVPVWLRLQGVRGACGALLQVTGSGMQPSGNEGMDN